ncbi:hypothetical protein [Brasilonema sp. UFV-L1]|uniref:hypothetical protein n=1 Tax=Brasilonema sp. UFV-L1 TaxID=2234130 RepID=UPI00403FB1FF
MNPDFLKYNQIVPRDWELAMPPICTPPISQVVFKNGVNIVAQSDRVSFWEALDPEHLVFQVPDISSKYIEIVPSVDYRAVGININAHIVAEKKEDNQDTVLTKVIAAGKWKNFQGKSPNAVVQFMYQLDNTNLTIAIQEVVFQQQLPQNQLVPVVNFSANFHRELVNSTYPEKIFQIKNIIQSWETDFKTFISFVEEAFLE